MTAEEELKHPEFFAYFLWHPGNTIKFWKIKDEVIENGKIIVRRYQQIES